jgi:flagella basal body P-ring formation protein FlgA
LAQLFRSRLSRFEESSGEKIALLIPSKVVVVAKPLAIGAREIEVELERKIKALCGACEVELASVALPAAAASLPTGATWQVKMRPELPRGPFSLPLEIKNGDGTRRLWWVSGVATLRKKAPVARRALAAGERIGEFDWAMELRDITYLADAAPDASEMASAWASRAIAPGKVIGRSAFRREAAVKLGETVRVVAGSGAWQVSAEGIAQQGGFVGETIRVRIPRTQKTVSGLLRDKGVVEVQ